MWDPISVFVCMWILNINLPNARLNVHDMIKDRENKILQDYYSNSISVRDGV